MLLTEDSKAEWISLASHADFPTPTQGVAVIVHVKVTGIIGQVTPSRGRDSPQSAFDEKKVRMAERSTSLRIYNFWETEHGDGNSTGSDSGALRAGADTSEDQE